jgi:hypothetical protein
MIQTLEQLEELKRDLGFKARAMEDLQSKVDRQSFATPPSKYESPSSVANDANESIKVPDGSETWDQSIEVSPIKDVARSPGSLLQSSRWACDSVKEEDDAVTEGPPEVKEEDQGSQGAQI